MDTEKLRRYVELDKRKADLKAELSDINSEMDTLEEVLLTQFEQDGIQNMNIDGRTVYLHRQLWASAEDKDNERATQALKAAGLGDMVAERFNTQTLSSWVREQVALADDDDLDDLFDALPDEFRGAIKVAERHQLRTRAR